MRRLTGLFSELPESKRRLAAGLIEQAAFLRVQLQDLADDIEENGAVEMFSQGKQEPYERLRPTTQSYNSFATTYLKTVGDLKALLPPEKQAEVDDGDGFDDFVCGRDGA